MFSFIVGVVIGAGMLLVFLLFQQRRIEALDEEKQLIYQEKQIVIDFMHGMVEALGEGLTREELFQRIVHAAILSTGALSACVFDAIEGERLRGVAVEGLFPPHLPLPEGSRIKLTTRAKFIEQILKSEEFSFGEGVVGSAAETHQAVLVENAQLDERVTKHDDPALAVHSLIAAPILFQDRLIGVLAVVNPADGLPFSSTDFSLVQSLAEQAGLAIHNNEFLSMQVEKKQLDLDLSVARNIQLMLIPQTFPSVEGIGIDTRYIPSQQVGGDLLDLFMLSENRLGLIVADVSGKGVPASLLMAICRTHLRHCAKMYESPSAVLEEVNRAMSSDVREDMFITVAYAVIDLTENKITFARAGHELPLLSHARNDGVVASEYLASEGMPIGMVESELFVEVIEDKTVDFLPGDVFVLYTDGITEAANEDDKEFSGARLADAVKMLRDRSAEEINSGILEHVDRFTGSTLYGDDLTLLTVKSLGAS
jgi:sigma-B regulation protein RsbU (phosphoserine phosphatase)